VAIRDLLLALFGAVWGFVVIMTVARTGTVPAELWATLGIGVGGILAAFRTDDRLDGRQQRRADGGQVNDQEDGV
jgi:hypothetical protein